MNGTVSGLSMAFMAVCVVGSVAVPVAFLLYLHKRRGAEIYPFFVGCAFFPLFALLLEGICNNLLLVQSPFGRVIQENLWLYALFGGLMAGLFEETGRYIAFRTVLKKCRDRDINALMYGAGHGGMEALLVLGIPSVSNLIYSLLINSDQFGGVSAEAPEEVRQQLENVVAKLIETPSWYFLLGLLERVFSIGLHIALSVLVWFAAKESGKRWLYPLSIVIHLAVDAGAVLLMGMGIPTLAVECAIGLMTAGAVLAAWKMWKSCRPSDASDSTFA